MLVLTQRTCQLGEKFSGKKIKDEDARSLKLELTDIEIDREELNAILCEPHAYEALYDTGANPVRPMLNCIKALELDAKLENAHVVLWYSLGATKVELKNATLTKIKIYPCLGAETRVSLTIEGIPPLDKKIVDLIEHIGTGIECEIRADQPTDQKDLELPVNTFGEGEQPETKRRGKHGRRGAGKRNGHRPSAH